MKYLISTIPGLGHFFPLVPLANKLQERGHEVLFCAGNQFGAAIEEAGFKYIPLGLDWDERDLSGSLPEIKSVPILEQAEWILSEIFMKRAPLKLVPELVAVIREQKPDAVIVTTFEGGASLAAEMEGIPWINFNISFRASRNVFRFLFSGLKGLRKTLGMPADKLGLNYGKHLILSTFPEEWNLSRALDAGYLRRFWKDRILKSGGKEKLNSIKSFLIVGVLRRILHSRKLENMQTETFAYFDGDNKLPEEKLDWVQELPKQPTVFATFGTTFNNIYPELFTMLIKAFKDQPMNLILAVGWNVDLNQFGTLPPNIIVKDYIPLKSIMPHVDLLLCHGGSSTVMETLRAGKPLLIFPLTADQPFISLICCELQLSVPLPTELMQMDSLLRPVVDPGKLSPELIREYIKNGLSNEALKQACLRFQQELISLPTVDDAVDKIESITRPLEPAVLVSEYRHRLNNTPIRNRKES